MNSEKPDAAPALSGPLDRLIAVLENAIDMGTHFRVSRAEMAVALEDIRALSASTVAPREMGWRPIAEAPRGEPMKAGPWVALWGPGWKVVEAGYYFRGQWCDGGPGYMNPTMFAPLLSPPTENDRNG